MAQKKMGAQKEWGLKRTCLSCGARFYDLNNDPMTCPKCEETFDAASLIKLRRNRNMTAEVKVKKPKDDILDNVDNVDNAEDSTATTNDDDLLDDTSDLGAEDNIVNVNKKDDD